MFCINCGKELPNDTKFCPGCGAKIEENNKNVESGIKSVNQETDSILSERKKGWKKVFDYKNYCILMAILVVIALIVGNLGKEVSANESEESLSTDNPLSSIEVESENTDSPSDNINVEDEQSTYEEYAFQAPKEQIVQDYMAKGYDSVDLLTHTVKENKEKADLTGTTDEIALQGSYSDKNNRFQVSEKIASIYAYWGEELGWNENYTQIYSDGVYDFSGFDNTYWTLPTSIPSNAFCDIFTNLPQDLYGEENATYYIKIGALEGVALNDIDLNEDIRTFDGVMQNSTIVMVCNGKAYTANLLLTDKAITLSNGRWELDFRLRNSDGDGSGEKLIYDANYEEIIDQDNRIGAYFLIPSTEEEFMNASQGAVNQIETESNAEESSVSPAISYWGVDSVAWNSDIDQEYECISNSTDMGIYLYEYEGKLTMSIGDGADLDRRDLVFEDYGDGLTKVYKEDNNEIYMISTDPNTVYIYGTLDGYDITGMYCS